MFNSSWNNVNFPTWKAFHSRQELNYRPNPIIPPALLNSEAIWVMTVGLMNMARLSSSSSPFCPDYIYTMPYNSAQRDPQCSWATLLTFHKGGLITNLKWNQIWRVPFAYFTALNETPARNESAGTFSIRLGFFGVGEGWHISKVYRLPLHLNGFMTIALILHDLMKTYWSRRIDTSAD